MSKRPNKIKSIDIIVKHIDEGKTYSESLEFFAQNWRVPQSTFSNYWKEAKEKHAKQREAINKKKLANTIEKEIEADDGRILGRIENLIILSEIARDTKEKANERINAIKTINQMQGYDAPIKSEMKIEQVPPIFNIDE